MQKQCGPGFQPAGDRRKSDGPPAGFDFGLRYSCFRPAACDLWGVQEGGG